MVDCNFLRGILTPVALDTCNRDPSILLSLLFCILGLAALVGVCMWIHYATMTEEQKKAAANAPPGFIGKMLGKKVPPKAGGPGGPGKR